MRYRILIGIFWLLIAYILVLRGADACAQEIRVMGVRANGEYEVVDIDTLVDATGLKDTIIVMIDSVLSNRDATSLKFKLDGKSGDHFTLHDRLKLSDGRGIASNDFAFTDVYDTDLTVSMPICSVMFNGRMDTLSARDITLSADSHVWLYTHRDSTRNVTETDSDPLDFDSAIRDYVVVLGEFYTDGNSVRLYLQPTSTADRWGQLYHYERAVHDHYIISGCEVTIPEASRRELRMSLGYIHYGLYHEDVDSVYTYTDTTAFGDSTLVLHWGVGAGNDSTSHTMQMPTDSVFDYASNQKVASVSNKWYKALIWLNGRNMAVQMANSASQSNTAARAQVEDPPPINTDNRDHALRLYWLVFQEGHDFSNAVLTDVREIHGTASGAVAVADHGESAGLTDDDHPQYLLRTDVYDSAAVAAYDTMLTHDEVDEIIGLNDSLATKATLTQLAACGKADSGYARISPVGVWLDTSGTGIQTAMWVNIDTNGTITPASNDQDSSENVLGIATDMFVGDSVYVVCGGWLDTTGYRMGDLADGKIFVGSDRYSRDTVESTASGKVYQQLAVKVGSKFRIFIIEAEIY